MMMMMMMMHMMWVFSGYIIYNTNIEKCIESNNTLSIYLCTQSMSFKCVFYILHVYIAKTVSTHRYRNMWDIFQVYLLFIVHTYVLLDNLILILTNNVLLYSTESPLLSCISDLYKATQLLDVLVLIDWLNHINVPV